MNSETPAPQGRPTLRSEVKTVNRGLLPQLGLFTTTMIIVGAVIGSGIFRNPGGMANDLVEKGVGSPELLIGIWVLAGVITLLGALTNAEVASMIPETGGQYVYFDKMYGPFVAYLYGWAIFAVIQTGSIAGIAYVFGEYFGKLFQLPQVGGSLGALAIHIPFIGDIQPFYQFGEKVVAAAVIIVLTVVNYFGVRFGGIVQNIFTVTKVAAIAALVILAFTVPGIGSTTNLTTASVAATATTATTWGLALAVAAALGGAFWAYDGWNNITYIAGEVKRPQRTIPRGLLYGMAIVMVVYVATNLAYEYVLPIDTMAKSDLVAADVADRIYPSAGRWIALAVMISTFGTANGTILASARVYFSMARHNVFPKFLGGAHPRFHTPAASLVVQCVWSVALLFSGTFDILTGTLIFISWIFYAAGAAGVIVLRKKAPHAERPYRVPGYPVVPILFILFALAYLVLTIYDDVASYEAKIARGEPAVIKFALGTALVLIGVPIYFYYRGRKKAFVETELEPEAGPAEKDATQRDTTA